MKTSEKKSIPVKSYDIMSLNQTVIELRDWVNHPYPKSYSACKNQFVKVMQIIQNRRYTLVRNELDEEIAKELTDKEKAIAHVGASLCEDYSQADNEIFKYLDGRLGPVPGDSIVMEAYHGSEMDKLGKDIRRFRQSVSDLTTELQNVIKKSEAGEAEIQLMSQQRGKNGEKSSFSKFVEEIKSWLKHVAERGWQIFTKSFWETLFDRVWPKQ